MHTKFSIAVTLCEASCALHASNSCPRAPTCTVYLGKQNFGHLSFFLDEVQFLIFDDSAKEKPSQRPRSGLSPARVLNLVLLFLPILLLRFPQYSSTAPKNHIDKLRRTTGP